MDARSLGIAVVVAGLVAAAIGLVIASGALGWFGRLPGDVRIEGRTVRFYFPITSMIVVSVVASIVLNVVRRLF